MFRGWPKATSTEMVEVSSQCSGFRSGLAFCGCLGVDAKLDSGPSVPCSVLQLRNGFREVKDPKIVDFRSIEVAVMQAAPEFHGAGMAGLPHMSGIFAGARCN